MANPEHIEMLKQGAEVWDGWRRENAAVKPDFSGADLGGISLRWAFLSASDFSGANLSGAMLEFSRFRNVDFSYANLSRANLSKVELGNSNLSGANLHRANLQVANLSGATLTNANLLEAVMGDTLIGDVDLSEVKNLEYVIHHGPSTIGIDTIYKSGGNIPEEFLLWCGVPEDFITYMRALTGKAIEFYSCFISYSSKDEEFAKRLHNDLQSEGVRCWFAPEDLKIGDRFRVRIDESIRMYDKLVLVLSENSVSSEWVGDEVEAALEKEEGQEGKVVLFPLRLDNAVMEIKSGWPAKVRRTRHIGDFSDWKNHDSYKKAFERLMRDLKAGEKR